MDRAALIKVAADGGPCTTRRVYWPAAVLAPEAGCVATRLQKDGADAVAWMSLAKLFSERSQEAHAEAAVRQAAVALKNRACSPFVRHWWYLGPFVIGKHEIDGDPTYDEPFHGPGNVPLDAVLFSEVRACPRLRAHQAQLVGQVKWQLLPATTSDTINISPKVRMH